MNSIVFDVFERIANTGGQFARLSKRKTLSWNDLESAVKLIFPGELKRHALSESSRATYWGMHALGKNCTITQNGH